jgi:hypothetical protein
MLLQLKPKELDAVSSYWFIKFGTHWAGPVSYIEVLQMLKTKKISRQALIRAGDSRSRYSGDWYPMSEIEEFSLRFIDDFTKYYVPAGRPFNQIRKFVRVLYNAETLIVNNDGQVVKAMCSELSAGGAKIRVPADSLEEGQSLMIHFFYNKALKLKSFKAKARVLRLSEIRFEGEEESKDDSQVYEVYAIEFEDLKPKHKKMLLKSTQVKIKSLASYLRQNNKSTVGVIELSEFSKKYPHLMLNP